MIDALFLQVVAAVLILLYGVRQTGRGFELAFGAGIKRALSAPGGGRAASFAAGAAGTVLLQSSGAVVTLLVTFSEISTLPLAQSLAVILGADLGSTLTVQLLSFRLYQYALPVLSAGILLHLASMKSPVRAAGQGVIGFGLILLALRFLAEAASELGAIGSFRHLLSDFSGAPVLAFAWGAGLSILFQSGTAVLILLIAFVQQGLLTASTVLPLVLGANVGAASVAFVAASGLESGGKRIAWGHFLMKSAGALLFLPVFPWAKSILEGISMDPSRLVANAHTLFNLLLAFLFLPFTPALARWLSRSIPDRSGAVPRGRAMYLDSEHLPVAGAALGQVAREILRLADLVQEMIDASVKAVRGGGDTLSDRLRGLEQDVDALTQEIKRFLSRLGEGALDAEQTTKAVSFVSIVSDLEAIADIVEKSVGDHVSRMAQNRQRFSVEGADEIDAYLREVSSMFREGISAFVTRDRKAAQNVIERKHALSVRERELRIAHIRRLQRGTPESLESSAAHLDILSSGKAIASHVKSIAYNVARMGD